MSKADEMLKELGYKLILDNGRFENENVIYLRYENEFGKHRIRIDFWNDKTVSKQTNDYRTGYITMEELQAINEKVKELGWND